MDDSFKSEIRGSTINRLLEKAEKKSYQQYLPKLTMKRLRGFTDEPVSFDFPVTAIIGPNGGGKTTVLGAAGCAYAAILPRRFFAKSGKYDESMQDWTIEYELIDKGLQPRDSFRRTASFKNLKWSRDALKRDVHLFGVSRTVPANERSELLKCVSQTFSVPDEDTLSFSEALQNAVMKILGKDVSEFRQLNVKKNGRVTLLTGTSGVTKYSEFHFGAGESSIIRMVSTIERAQDNALILIEEIENGLHPVATVRLVEYLIEVADRKRIQVIFTTHSNEALRPLPSKAVWVATQDRLFQGKLDVRSLRAITGRVQKQAAIFVEDDFAKLWVEAILRQSGTIPLDHVEVHAMEGDGTAVAMNKYHNRDPSVTAPSVCIIDGDSAQVESEEERVIRLPGESPEAAVFDNVLIKWPSIGGKVCVALLQQFEASGRVLEVCEEVRRTNRDPHLLYVQVGERLGFIPEATVSNAFTNLWAQAHAAEVGALVEKIAKAVPAVLDSGQQGHTRPESVASD